MTLTASRLLSSVVSPLAPADCNLILVNRKPETSPPSAAQPHQGGRQLWEGLDAAPLASNRRKAKHVKVGWRPSRRAGLRYIVGLDRILHSGVFFLLLLVTTNLAMPGEEVTVEDDPVTSILNWIPREGVPR